MSTWLLPAASLLSRSLGWALLHSLWQGLLVFTALYLLFRLMKNAAAGVKYNLSYTALAGMAVWFVYTWAMEWQRLKGITVYITSAGADAGAMHTQAVTTLPQYAPGVLYNILSLLEQYIPVLVILYLCGLLIMLLRFAANIFNVRSLQSKGTMQPPAAWTDLAAFWQAQLNVIFPVKLLLSCRIQSPVMAGILRPVILLPLSAITQLSTEQVEAILLHELAHVKRHDYLLNLLQVTIETLLFFNPFVWLVSGVIRREREHCCDDMAVEHTAQPLPYAKALAALEASRYNTGNLAIAATGNKQQLLYRIKRIMEMKKKTPQQSQAIFMVIAIGLIGAAIICFTPSFAQKAKNNKISQAPTAQQEETTRPADAATDTGNRKNSYLQKGTTVIVTTNDEGNDDDNTGDMVHIDTTAFSNMGKSFGKMGEGIALMTLTAVDSAMKQMDWHQVDIAINEAKKSIDNVDWDKITDEVNESIKNVDGRNKEISIEIRKELENSRKEMAKARKEIMIETSKAREEAQKEQRAAMANAHANSKTAYAYSYTNSKKTYEPMLQKMEKDGLINRHDGFKIKKEDDRLYINGKAQPACVYDKYSPYLNGDKVRISGDDNHMSVSIEQ